MMLTLHPYSDSHTPPRVIAPPTLTIRSTLQTRKPQWYADYDTDN